MQIEQAPTERTQSLLVMSDAPALDDPPVGVDDADRVFFAGPVDPRKHLTTPLAWLTVAGGEVPWRVLIDGALTAQLPVATQGTSTDRREALVSCWPSTRASAAGALPATAGIPEDDQ